MALNDFTVKEIVIRMDKKIDELNNKIDGMGEKYITRIEVRNIVAFIGVIGILVGIYFSNK